MSNPNLKNAYLPLTRVHVTEGYRWGQAAGTNYWLNWNSNFDLAAAAATTIGEQLAENGWTATSLVNTAGSGADFGGGGITKSSAPGPKSGNFGGVFADNGIPNHALSNASGDLLLSPAIFGNGSHMRQAARLAGKSILPRYLVARFDGSMSVNSAAEVRSSWGFFTAAATDSTVEASQLAAIQSNSANFLLAGAAATMTTGAAVDTSWHEFEIVLAFNGSSAANVFWYIDGTLQSTTAGVAAQDVFPCRFGFGAFTTNRPLLGGVEVFYDW